MDLLVHTARLWRSLGHYDGQGRFHIDGVTGPDEYSAVADDNVYTNLMAAENLRAAADVAKQYTERARDLGVSDEESAGWRDAAEAMAIPFDETRGVHPQAAGSPGTRSGTSPAPRPGSTRSCCTSPTSTCTASR
jgi:alpha,alpha-trehalose phosphorylase